MRRARFKSPVSTFYHLLNRVTGFRNCFPQMNPEARGEPAWVILASCDFRERARQEGVPRAAPSPSTTRD